LVFIGPIAGRWQWHSDKKSFENYIFKPAMGSCNKVVK
jgi:hypothetical protein